MPTEWERQYEKMQAAWRARPGYSELERALLSRGGKRVALREEPDLRVLLAEGVFVPGRGATVRTMRGSNCHGNTAQLWRDSSGEVQIVTGWALSPDGIWRQHSWGWDTGRGAIVETTGRRTLYYGVGLEGSDAAAFAESN